MSLDGTYDAGNIFGKILRGEMPCARVFEDDHVLSFMDVFPQARGHTLVIPKRSTARNLLEAAPEVLGPLMAGVQRVARGVRAALKPDGLMISQFNGAVAGQTVFHLHVHIIPRWAGVDLGRHGAGMTNLERRAFATGMSGGARRQPDLRLSRRRSARLRGRESAGGDALKPIGGSGDLGSGDWGSGGSGGAPERKALIWMISALARPSGSNCGLRTSSASNASARPRVVAGWPSLSRSLSRSNTRRSA